MDVTLQHQGSLTLSWEESFVVGLNSQWNNMKVAHLIIFFIIFEMQHSSRSQEKTRLQWLQCVRNGVTTHCLAQEHRYHINLLVQERRNSSALAMEFHLSCSKPLICTSVLNQAWYWPSPITVKQRGFIVMQSKEKEWRLCGWNV